MVVFQYSSADCLLTNLVFYWYICSSSLQLNNVRDEIFQQMISFKIFTELLVYEMQKGKTKEGVTDFVSEIKRLKNYPSFQKLALVIQHGLQEFIIKNIEDELTEANDLSHIYFVEVDLLRK